MWKTLIEVAIVLTPVIVYSYQKTFTIETVLCEVFQDSFIRKVKLFWKFILLLC